MSNLWPNIFLASFFNLTFDETVHSYEFLEKSDDNETFYCSSCLNAVIPFGKESNQTFSQTNVIGLNNESDLENLSVFINKNEQKLINQISNLIL